MRGEVPEDLDRVVMRAISTPREDRHYDAEELLADLERLHPLGADLTSDAIGLRVDRDPRQSHTHVNLLPGLGIGIRL